MPFGQRPIQRRVKVVGEYGRGMSALFTGKPNRFVLILSPIRSGSTLLKALLAEGPGVSHLPEVDFQTFSQSRLRAMGQVAQLSSAKTVVLKKPSWFSDAGQYPRLPNLPTKNIILVRRPDAVVRSIKKRQSEHRKYPQLDDAGLAQYWLDTYRGILSDKSLFESCPYVVYYESLLENPIETTLSLFNWIGLKDAKGVDHYSPPTDFSWRYGKDDGSANIKSLRVLPERAIPADDDLTLRLAESPDIRDIYKSLRSLHRGGHNGSSIGGPPHPYDRL